MVVKAFSSQASEEQLTREMRGTCTGAIKNTKDKYTVAPSLEENEPLRGAIQYSSFGHDTIIERNLDTFESRDQAYERRNDFEAREESRDDASRDVGVSYVLSRELYTESSDDTVYHDAKTGYSYASQTPRSLICEAFSFHREDLALKFVFTNDVESTVDESMNANSRTVTCTQSNASRDDYDVPPYVLPTGSSFLGEMNRSESSNYLNEIKDNGEAWSAPTSPVPGARIAMPWSPRMILCGGLNEQEFNDVVQSFVDNLTESTSDKVELKGDEAQHGHFSIMMSASSIDNQEVNETVHSSEKNASESTNRMTESKVSPPPDTSIVLRGNKSDMTYDLIEPKEPGCISDLLEISLLCRPLPAGGLIEAQELNEIIESLESNKSVSTDYIVESKGDAKDPRANLCVMMSAPESSPTPVAKTGTTWSTKSLFCGALPADMASHGPTDAQELNEIVDSIETKLSVDETEVVWDAHKDIHRKPMKTDIPVSTCEKFQQDKIYSIRKATKSTGTLVEVAAEEAFWNPEQKVPLNRRHEHSRQKAAVIEEIRKEAAALRKEQARNFTLDTVRDVVSDLCFRDAPDERNISNPSSRNGRLAETEGDIPSQLDGAQQSFSDESKLKKSELKSFKQVLKPRLSSRPSLRSKQVPCQSSMVQAVHDLCFMGSSERLVRYEDTLLLETAAQGTKANASARINNLKKADSPVPESVQGDPKSASESLGSTPPKESTQTAEVNHDMATEKQLSEKSPFDKELSVEPNLDSPPDQNAKSEESTIAAVNEQKDRKMKLKPFTRVINKSLRSSHRSYSAHTFGQNAEIIKAVRDLVFIDESIAYEGNTLLSETHAKGTKLLASEIELKKRHSLDERDPAAHIDEGYELLASDIELRKRHSLDEERDPDADIDDGYELLASEIELRKRHSLDEKRDPDADTYEGYEVNEHGIVLSDTSFPFDSAERTKALPIVSTLDEDINITAETTEALEIVSTLDEDIKIMFQAGIFAFNDIIADDELRCKMHRNLTAMFDDENKLLIPASKELLPLYHVLKVMIAEHQGHGSASTSSQFDACQLCAPLDVMKDLQAWVAKHLSPK